ncbi:hypothetical protein CKO28_00890 [Rhodovibrio sodomensis]|uniref:Uncharacterized protein n=1 Tax=Rhodovibrio sodomensis TaxID=1088 RepID=A0ABS1D849_9PROT|nr:hypothetical protein [Rhodovibrio sodomensis]MBK1666598.1 hypothetical protein [Rhodovibrio sodomensis]
MTDPMPKDGNTGTSPRIRATAQVVVAPPSPGHAAALGTIAVFDAVRSFEPLSDGALGSLFATYLETGFSNAGGIDDAYGELLQDAEWHDDQDDARIVINEQVELGAPATVEIDREAALHWLLHERPEAIPAVRAASDDAQAIADLDAFISSAS